MPTHSRKIDSFCIKPSLAGGGQAPALGNLSRKVRAFSDLQSVIDAIPASVFVKDRRHRIVLLNDSACALFGRPRQVLLESADGDLFPAEQIRVFRQADDKVFATGEDEREERVSDGAGQVSTVITRKRRIRIAGADYLLAIVTDVSAHRRAEAHNRHLALHDMLTGLPNRAMLNERIDQALAQPGGRPGPWVLFYIDLDNFKGVNETYGHPAGDEVVRAFAQRLTALVGPLATVARLGGDEFAILLSDYPSDRRAQDICLSVLAAGAQPFVVGEAQILLSASVGLAFASDGVVGQAELQRRCDIALHQAKNAGRGCCRAYDEVVDERIRANRLLESEMREALVDGTGLEVCYQPIASVQSGQIEVFEALARWRHPVRGLVMPGEFIPMAEASGLIVELGEWVLRQACADAAGWDPPLRLSVNVSPVQFAKGDLVGTVKKALAASGLSPTRLELEITEGVLLQDPNSVLTLLNTLRGYGIKIVLDDFGTGYSSLSYFRQFPFDKIKIDRSFITDMNQSSHARSIVETIISLGRGLNLQVVAEGVETKQQLDLLREQGCGQVQGYFISRPMPISHFIGSVLRPFPETETAPR